MGRHSKYPTGAGIYKLTCIDTGKIYVGKTVNFRDRFSYHKNCGNKSYGKCHFQNAIRKYGWDSFSVEILEIFTDFTKSKDNTYLLERESYYIELLNSTDPTKGYNICKHSNDRTGVPHTEEAKEKMRQAAINREYSEKEKERLRTINIGRTLTNEHKEKIKQGNTGKFVSEETRKKLSDLHKGKAKSREHIEKVRKSNLGRKASDETKEKMRQSKLRRDALNLTLKV
jgi:group I intron endonuclease